ncbi:MAG TPA: HAD family hydrolase [Sporichthya sp.]|nr:HAD family hydrolase [Sporichthya sp.]
MTGPRPGNGSVNGALDAVIFDWGGTLTRWRQIDIPGTWQAVAAVAVAADPSLSLAELGRRLAEVDERLWARCRNGDAESTRFADVLAECGLAEHPDLLAAHLGEWEVATELDPDVPAVLAGLRERGLRVGVLSNTIWPRAEHEAWFARDGVLELIDGAVYSSEIAWAKPHPEAFRAAAAAVGAEPERVLFVGDRPFEDIHGAAQVGMRTALVPFTVIGDHERGPLQGEADAVLERLLDVLDLVDRWR